MTKYHTLKNDIDDILTAFETLERKADARDRGPLVLSGLTYQCDHAFPNPDDLLAVGQECRLQFHRALALILKGEWERGFTCKENGWPSNTTHPFTNALSDGGEHAVKAANFNPDTAELFAMFHRNGNQATEAGYEGADFDTLVQQMILADLHLAANNGPELTRFAETETARQTMLRDTTAVEREAFWKERCRWGQAQEELDTVHTQIEQRRLMNSETKREYLSLFGRCEVELQEATHRYWDLKRRKTLKEANPALNKDEIAELVAETESHHKKQLDELEHNAALAPILLRTPGSGQPVDSEQLRKLRARAKSLLRELRSKIHPDHLNLDPAYQRLTEIQKQELQDMLRQALNISPAELGFPPGLVGRDMRSVQGLEDALDRVDAILKNAGLDTRIDAQIQGRTLLEQLEWLQRMTVSLQRRLDAARAEFHALATDPEAQRLRNVLSCPERHETIREAMQKKTAEYHVKAERIQEELQTLFGPQEKEVHDGLG